MSGEWEVRYWYWYEKESGGPLKAGERGTLALFTSLQGALDWLDANGLDRDEHHHACAFWWRFVDHIVLWHEEHGITHYCMDPWPEEHFMAWPVGQLMEEQDRMAQAARKRG